MSLSMRPSLPISLMLTIVRVWLPSLSHRVTRMFDLSANGLHPPADCSALVTVKSIVAGMFTGPGFSTSPSTVTVPHGDTPVLASNGANVTVTIGWRRYFEYALTSFCLSASRKARRTPPAPSANMAG